MEIKEFPTDEENGPTTYDWGEVFGTGEYSEGLPEFYAVTTPERAQKVDPITPGQVAEVVAYRCELGSYAETEIRAVFRLHDDRYALVNAWCDSTGWDCQAGVTWYVGTRDEVLNTAVTAEDRAWMGMPDPHGEGE